MRNSQFIIILLIFIAACKITAIKTEKPADGKMPITNIIEFFKQSKNDMLNAKKVIIDKDLVINLSHLNFMNAGGKKYYLLERENITKMIESVTRTVYEDFILINKKGKIIYTKKNDDIFGKTIGGLLKNTPVMAAYKHRNIAINYEDVAEFLPGSSKYGFFISSKVSGRKSFPGIFILQVSLAKLQSLLIKNQFIVGQDGTIRVSNSHKPMQSFNCFANIKVKQVGSIDEELSFNCNGDSYVYRIFNSAHIHWYIITKK